MIGRNDDRRKEEAVKKAQLELKKKEKEAVREV
jgi:U3 small nucleolar RNA-associated protein 24